MTGRAIDSRVRCHKHLTTLDDEGLVMDVVASFPSGWDTIKVYQCASCGRQIALQLAPTVGGYPEQVKMVLPVPPGVAA